MTPYLAELYRLRDELRDQGFAAEVSSPDCQRFLVVDLGTRGAELYGSADTDGWIVDPAEDHELLGEVSFPSLANALDALRSWLRDGIRPSPSAPLRTPS